MKNYILSLLILLLISSFGFAQQSNNTDQQLKKEWKLFKEQEGIQVYYNYMNCYDAESNMEIEYIVLKFVSSRNTNVSIRWDLKIWSLDVCQNCDEDNNPDFKFAMVLKPNETKVGNCENREKNRGLTILSKRITKLPTAEVSKFEFRNFTVKPF